jgi:hypothetical protein
LPAMYTFRETIELFLQCNKPGDVGSRGGEMSAAASSAPRSSLHQVHDDEETIRNEARARSS